MFDKNNFAKRNSKYEVFMLTFKIALVKIFNFPHIWFFVLCFIIMRLNASADKGKRCCAKGAAYQNKKLFEKYFKNIYINFCFIFQPSRDKNVKLNTQEDFLYQELNKDGSE